MLRVKLISNFKFYETPAMIIGKLYILKIGILLLDLYGMASTTYFVKLKFPRFCSR